MQRAVSRVLGYVAIAVLTSLTVLTTTALTSPASAADQNLGWVRLQPASGTTDIAVLALTQGPCPGGRAVVVTMRGPNIEPSNRLGNMVGVTEYKAFDPTVSGQLWIPLSFTFQQWFDVNSVKLVPGKPYTLTVVCRDLLRASSTFGTFSGQVVFDGKGGYKAIGQAAEPFNTQLKPKDPNGIPIPLPSDSSSASAAPSTGTSQAPASPSASESAPAPASSAATTPSVDPSTSTAPSAPSTLDPESEAAAPSTPTSTSGGSGGLLLGGLAVLALAGGAWTLYSRRRAAPSSDSTDTP